MEEKKIKYPFKNFVKNILLGIILVLSVFCLVPVVKLITNNVSDNVEATSGKARIYVYGYYENGEIRELDNASWGWFFGGSGSYYQYGGGNGSEWRIYYTKDTGLPSMNGKRDYALGNDLKEIPVSNSGESIKFIPETGGDDKAHVVGIFTSNTFEPDNCIAMAKDTKSGSGLTAKLYVNNTYYVLLSMPDYYINFDIAHYMQIDGITFQSDFGARNMSETIKMGECIWWSNDNYEYPNKIKIGNTEIKTGNYLYCYVSTTGSYYYLNMWCSNSGKCQRINITRFVSFTNKRETGKTYTIKVDEYAKFRDHEKDKIQFDRSKKVLQYNIDNVSDLKKFANDVNKGYLNQLSVDGINYRAVMQKDIDSYTGDPIGKDNDRGAFQGEFDGNGKTIGAATINPVLGISDSMSEAYKFNNVISFGIFGYTSNATIINLKIGTIRVNTYSYIQQIIDDYGHEIIPPKTICETSGIILACDTKNALIDPYVGALIGTANETKIERVEIDKFKPVFAGVVKKNNEDGTASSDSYRCGGLVGKMSGGYIDGCKLNEFHIEIETIDSWSYINYEFGGFVAHAKNVEIKNSILNDYKISPKSVNVYGTLETSWSKHDGYRFYAGGLVGYMNGGNIYNCRVEGGTQDFTGVYHTELIAIGGLVGYQHGGRIESSTSKSLIVMKYLVGGGANKTTDYLCVGGLVGLADTGASIYDSYYQNADTLKVISGQQSGTLFRAPRRVVFGGLVGWTGHMINYNTDATNGVEIKNSSAYITGGVQMGSSDYKNDQSYFGFFVGVSGGGTMTLTSCYSIIKDNRLNTITANSYTQWGMVVNAVNHLEKLPTDEKFKDLSDKWDGSADQSANKDFKRSNVTYTNCYISRGKMAGTFEKRDDNTSNNGDLHDYITGSISGVKVFNNISNNDYLNNLFGSTKNYYTAYSADLYDSTNNKLYQIGNKNGTQVIKPIYGYNSAIQSGSVAGSVAGPFVLGSADFKNYINILINCTKQGKLEYNNLYYNRGFKYYSDNELKYIYGAGVLGYNREYTYRFPMVTKGGVNCTYYSLYQKGYDENGNPSIFARPGDVISTDISKNQGNSYRKENLQLTNEKQENYTVYPIFDEIFEIYSATKLQIKGKYYDEYTNKPVTIGNKYSVTETKLSNPNGIYIYRYTIVSKEHIENKTDDKGQNEIIKFIRNILSLDIKGCFGKYESGVGTAITHSSLNDLFEDGGSTIKYFSGRKYDLTCKDETGQNNYTNKTGQKYINDATTDDIDASKSLYFNVYRMSNFYVGQLTIDEKSEAIKIGNSYAGEYTRKYIIPLFFAGLRDDGNENIKIISDFSGYTIQSDFGNLSVTTADNRNKIVYVAANALSSSSPLTSIIDENGNTYSKLGIYSGGNKKVSFGQSDYRYKNDFNIYPLYQEPGIFLRYFKDVKDENPTTTDRIEYQSNGTLLFLIFNAVTTYDITIKNYNDLFGADLKHYDFVGWELTINGIVMFVYPKSFTSITIPGSWVTGNEVIYLDFKPIFVTNKDKEIDALNCSSYSLTLENGCYQVDSVEDLIYVAYLVNYGGETTANIKLGANIDMTGIENFMPIGFNTESPFSGYFNGQGYNIYNLKITAKAPIHSLSFNGFNNNNNNSIDILNGHTSDVYIGLFGLISGRNDYWSTGFTQGNVNLINISYEYQKSINETGTIYLGGFAGSVEGGAKISKVLVDGEIKANVTSTDCYVGGISGHTSGNGGVETTIEQCVTQVRITVDFVSNHYDNLGLGSMVGLVGSFTTISNCFDRNDKDDFKVNSNPVYQLTYSYPQISYGLVGHYWHKITERKINNSGYISDLKAYSISGVSNVYISNCYSSQFRLNVSLEDYKDNIIRQIRAKDNSASVNNMSFSGFSITVNNVVLKSDIDISKFGIGTGVDYASVWAQNDNVNGGLPYLKATGIKAINFVIDGWSNGEGQYYLTPEDKDRMIKIGAKRSGDDYMVSQDYFVLDILSFLRKSRGESEYNGTVSGARQGEFVDFFTNKIEDLKVNGEKFWKLEGYNFEYLDANKDDLGIYEKTGWPIKLVANIFHYANGSYDVYANFTPKEISVKYVFKFKNADGIGYEEYIVDDGISGKGTMFAEEYKSQQINISSLENELQTKLYAKRIKSFRIYIPEKNTYLNISGDYNELSYVDENSAGRYEIGTEFMLSRIDNIKKNEYQLYLVITEDDLEDIEFKLNFFDENEKEYDAFDANGVLAQWDEDGAKYIGASSNYIIKKYNDVLAENPNYFPSITKTGYTFKGWGYYTKNDKTKELTIFYSNGDMNMLDLRISPYLATYDGEYYYLDLYPIFVANTFTNTRYYDGYESLSSAELITYHNDKDFGGVPKYGEKIKLYNHDKLSEFEVYNRHPGYKLSGFIFTDDTKNAINALNSKQKDDTIAYIDRLATKLNVSVLTLCGVDIITHEYLADACINVLNYMLQTNSEFDYFIPLAVDLICVYGEATELEFKVELTNSNDVDMYYQIYRKTRKYDDKTISFVEEKTEITKLEFSKPTENSNYIAYINVYYNDIVYIYTNLKNGTRINKITHEYSGNSLDLYEFSGYETSLDKFVQSDLSKFACMNIGVIDNERNYDGIKGSLTYYYDIENYNNGNGLNKDTNQYYMISGVTDLVEYFNSISTNGDESAYKLAKLTKNINITGLKLNLNTFPKDFVFDGNGYTLNGFTNFNIDISCLSSNFNSNYQTYGLITYNYGTIKNLNFDNVCVNLSITKIDSFGLITSNGTSENNIGTIENVNILGGIIKINSLKTNNENDNVLIFGGLVSENSGKISNVSVQNLKVSIGESRNVFAGLVCGSNSGEINNVVINDGNTLTISSAEVNYASLCTGMNAGTIKNVIINSGSISAQNQASLVAYTLSGKQVGTLSFVADFTDLSFVGDFTLKADSIQKIINKTSLKSILNQNFVGSNFKFAYDYLTKTEKLVIPFVNVHLIIINTANNLENKEIEFNEKINDVFVDENKQTIFANNVLNKLKFNSTDYAENTNLNFAFTAFRNGKDQTGNLIVSNQVNQGAINQNLTNAFVNTTTVSKEDNILFEYSAKEYNNFTFTLTYTKSSNFSGEEKTEIQKSIKILVNGIETNLRFAVNGTAFIVDSNNEIVKLKYFDKIEIKFDFPSIAFLSENGLKLNGSIVRTNEISSKNAQKFDFTHYLETTSNFVAEVARRAVKLTFDLNKESLTDEVEKNKIKFNEDAIKKLLTDKGYKSIINDFGQLEVEVAPIYEFANFVYKLPEIIKIIDGNLYQVLDYVDNGINYKFNGFVGENDNIYYYNADFTVARDKFSDNLTLKAKFEKVKYTIEIDGLNGACYFPVLNGYVTSNGKTQKNIYFSDDMSVPTAQMLVYTNSYVFKGYKIKDTNIMVSSATKQSDGTISHTFNQTFETLNANYTSHREENELRIVLIPVFEEVGYDLVFKDGENNDEYSAYLYYENSEYDAKHYDEIHMNLSISKILSTNYVLPLGYKEHHSFVGFRIEGDESQEIVIAYNGGELVYNKEILIGSKTFVAVYEIDKIEIKLEIKDVNTQNKLDYEVVNLNDVLSVAHSYKIDDEKNIVFVVDYNTTGFNLPQINLTDDNYKFSNYMVNNDTYSSSYKFTQDITINISCMYKIIYQTKLAEIKNTYYLVSSNRLNKVDELSYSFYANFGETITLPTKEEVIKTGFNLSGYKKDGDNLAFQEDTPSTFVALGTFEIEFIFTGETYSLILDAQQYSCKLPKSLINRFIESYDLFEDNERKAIIKVVYGTLVEDIRNALPTLYVDGFTFDGYEFSETGTITQNGTITPRFLQNEYEIIVYDADGTRITDVTKHFNEEIDSSFYQTIENHANNTATENNVVFKGLSLDKKYYIGFNNLDTMPSLEKDYKDYVEKTGNKYTIKVYCYYISNIIVTIKANENSMITNENTQGISEFTGGNAYNANARFKLSANDIMSGATIVLPIPQIKQDSELEFANFVGYSIMVGENKVIVVDSLGRLLNDFDYTRADIELVQEFEYKTYNFNISANYDSVQNDEYFDFIANSYGLSKQIKFGEIISNLPILNLTHYNFVGYYFSNNNSLVVDSQDIKIADFEGKTLPDYENLGIQYFEKVNGQYQLKTIYAKYEVKYIDVVIKTSNIKLGTVAPIYLLDGTLLTYSQVENGYIVKVPSGKDILISTTVNSLVATFKDWTINLSGVDVTNNGSIENALNQSTIIKNITESYEIVANYDYITFNITYIVDGEEQELNPKEFNIDTPEFNLPTFERYGYDFIGWYLEENFINIKQTINPSVYSRDITLYGKIENKKVNLNIYSSNIQGYTLHSVVSATYNKLIDSLPNIVLDGYYFVGFFTGSEANGIKIDSSSLSIFVNDTNIYAFFEEKIQNKLSGEGTEANPYEIRNEQDFKVFVQMSNYENIENKYFKLSSSINLTEKYVINSFNSNFNGDGYVLYLNNGLYGYNYLNSDGEIIKNISLFGENIGLISNLIISISQNNLNDVLDEFNTHISLSLFANKNNGEIKNVIAYFNFNLQNLDFENEFNSFDVICKDNQNVTEYSVVNSVLTDKNSSKTFDSVLDKHLHSKNVLVVNKNEENVFEVYNAEQFAYLLTENSAEEINISLKSNIDFKGKLLQKTTNKISIQGNGYILSNLIILDQSYLFDSLTLNKTAIENVTLINLYNNCNLILNSNKLDYSYIEIDLTNCQNLISQSSGEINNSYFVSKSLTNLVENINANINNVYLINFNKPNSDLVEFTNFVNFDLNNLDNVDNFIENSQNLDNDNLWFKDAFKVMSDYQLPKLIGVGNVVYQFNFDENLIQINSFNNSFINNNLIITKNSQELLIYIELINSQEKLVDILVNGQSYFNEYDEVFSIISISKTNLNYNVIEFVTELKDFDVDIEVDEKGKGNKVQLGEESGEKITISVKSGTKVSDLNIQTIEGEGYKFVGYNFFDENGNIISEEDPKVLNNLKIVAKFEKLITYKLYLNNYENIIVTDNKLENFWNKVQENEYVIYLALNEDIFEYLPQITKQDYVFSSYSVLKLGNLDYKVLPMFSPDYVKVTLNYNNMLSSVDLVSENEYSLVNPELKIVEKDENSNNLFYILRGYDVNLTINFNGSYLTKVTVNGEDLFDDYTDFVNKDEQVVKLISLDKNLNEHTINISLNEIIVETKFEFDIDLCSIELLNATFDLSNYTVSTRKDFDLQFVLNINDSKIIDNIVFTNSLGEEVLAGYTQQQNTITYIVKESLTIKINLTDKKLLVVINQTEGGNVEVGDNLEKTIIDDNTYSVSLNYGQDLNLTITPLDGYKPTKIAVLERNFDIKPNILLSDITQDLSISVTFTKLATWLDLDENNQPKHFALSNFVGFGTETNPYLISNYNDFLTLSYNINVLNIDYTGKYFKSSKRDLKIDLSRYYFVPITSFNGTILGDNLTISGLKIYADTNASLFKLLGANAYIKSINIDGEIEGNFMVAGLASVNNGTIIGCSNKTSITNNNDLYTDTNITAGICAVNNGKISRTFNAGSVSAKSVKVAGICAVNNGTIDNIYNTGMLLSENNYAEPSFIAGICAENNNIIQIGYNNSRVINKTSNENTIVVGTVQNKNGSYQNLYFNNNQLSIQSVDARTYEELTDKENAIYVNFDASIWQFQEYEKALPILKTCYEYLGTLSFQVIFDENLADSEKLVLAEVFNELGETYGLALRSQNRIYKISNLNKGLYKIRLKSVLGSLISTDNNLEIQMNENTGENVSIKIVLTKTNIKGYYGYVVV